MASGIDGSDDFGEQIVLSEDPETDFEPGEEEIHAYAKDVLGMNPEEDPDLLYIARDALKAPLPPGWKPCQDRTSGEIYFFNFSTGESRWEHPSDDEFKELYLKKKQEKQKQQDSEKFTQENDRKSSRFDSLTSGSLGNVMGIDELDSQSENDDEEKHSISNQKKDATRPKTSVGARPSSKGLSSLGQKIVGGTPFKKSLRNIDDDDDDEPSLSSTDSDPRGDIILGSPQQREALQGVQSLTPTNANAHNDIELERPKSRVSAAKPASRGDSTISHAIQLQPKFDVGGISKSPTRLDPIRSNNTKHAHVEKPPTHSPTDTSAAYNSSPAATSHDYKEKLAALETSNAAEIQRLKKENEAEIAKLKNEFSSEIHKLKETHITQKDKLEHDYNDEIEKLRKSKEEELSKLQQNLDVEKQVIKEKHTKEISTMRQSHEKAMEEFRLECSKEKEQAEAEKQKVATVQTEVDQEISRLRTSKEVALEKELEELRSSKMREAEAIIEQDISKRRNEYMSIFETELQTKREEHKQALSRLLAEHDKEMETKQSLLSQQQQEVEKEVREAGEKKLEELHKEIQTLQDACDEQERQLNDRLQSLKTQIASESSKLETELEQLRADQEDLKNQREEVSQEKEKLEQTLTDLQEQVSQAEQTLTDLQEQISQAEQIVQQQETLRDTIISEVAETQGKLKSLQEQIAEEQSKLSSTKSLLYQDEQDYKQLQEGIRKLQESMEGLRTEYETVRGQRNEMKAEYNNLESKLEILRKEQEVLSNRQEELHSLEESIQAATDELENVKRAEAQKREELAQQQHEKKPQAHHLQQNASFNAQKPFINTDDQSNTDTLQDDQPNDTREWSSTYQDSVAMEEAKLERARRFLRSQQHQLEAQRRQVEQAEELLDRHALEKLPNDKVLERVQLFLNDENRLIEEEDSTLKVSQSLLPFHGRNGTWESATLRAPFESDYKHHYNYTVDLEKSSNPALYDPSTSLDGLLNSVYDSSTQYPFDRQQHICENYGSRVLFRETQALRNQSFSPAKQRSPITGLRSHAPPKRSGDYHSFYSSTRDRDFVEEHKNFLRNIRQEMSQLSTNSRHRKLNSLPFRQRNHGPDTFSSSSFPSHVAIRPHQPMRLTLGSSWRDMTLVNAPSVLSP